MKSEQPHFFLRKRRLKVEARILIESPASFVLEGIQRYFKAQKNTLDLTIQLEPCRDTNYESVTERVVVDYEAHVRRPLLRRRNDRLVFKWRMQGAMRPTFVGRLTVIPSASDSELLLEGRYLPPFEQLEAVIRRTLDQGAAEAICWRLLESLKLSIETEFRMYEDLRASGRFDESYPAPLLGWKSALARLTSRFR